MKCFLKLHIGVIVGLDVDLDELDIELDVTGLDANVDLGMCQNYFTECSILIGLRGPN